MVAWIPPLEEDQNGIVRSYTVNVTELNTGSQFQRIVMGTDILLDQLHPYYVYQVTVAAFTIGNGPFSAPVSNITHPAGKECLTV